MKVLVTGGAGYIGSHTALELLNANYEVVVADNLSNSKIESIKRVEQLTNKKISFYKIDVCDETELNKVFLEHKIDSVIHFAGLKAVGESVKVPLKYYENNIISTISLVKAMKKNNVKNLVFSSSATVYGVPKVVPIVEDSPLSTSSPYGRTKLFIEQILQDEFVADSSLNIALLRYFNPVGAHKSGKIGEDPNGIPNNLMPYITQVAIGKLEKLSVFGNDYNTPDGTGVRDYIHVVDLAQGHVAALAKLETRCGLVIYNLGTGIGYSVLDIVEAFKTASGKSVPYKITPRRQGDVDACYSDPSKAKKELGWSANETLKTMCEDSWRWQSQNPKGYQE